MLLNILFASLLVLLTWIFVKWYKMKTFWINKGIPQCTVLPIIGSLTFALKVNPNIWLKKVFDKYSSPYVGVWLFWRPGLVINCPKLARNILVKDFDNFRDRFLGTGTNNEISTQNLFTVNDPVWSYFRKRLMPVFSSAKLKAWHDLYQTKSNDFIEKIKSDSEKGKRIDLRSVTADYTTDIIGESAFGVTCEATKNGDGAFRTMTKDFEKFNLYRGIQWTLIFFFPEVADFFGFALWPQHTVNYFTKLFKLIVENRGGYKVPVDGKKDMLDALRKTKQDAMENGEDIKESLLAANAMIFLQGGYDTSSATLTYLFYELAHQPHYQQIIYDEIMEAQNKIGDAEFKSSDLIELPYLNAAIKEITRKYPIMGWLDRIAANDYVVDENLTIPAGTPVLINAYGMQASSKYYPKPEEFRPERFLPENEKNIEPYTYLSFGEGPRFCIGKRFAMNTLLYVSSKVIKTFILKPYPNSKEPNDIAIENKALFYLPGEVMTVEFIQRE